jgi:acetyl-CoA C-acetyltransferase
MQMLGIDPDRVNVNGGAIAMGHPIGASGARILGALIHEMRRRNAEYGASSICSGMAQGEATIVRLAA